MTLDKQSRCGADQWIPLLIKTWSLQTEWKVWTFFWYIWTPSGGDAAVELLSFKKWKRHFLERNVRLKSVTETQEVTSSLRLSVEAQDGSGTLSLVLWWLWWFELGGQYGSHSFSASSLSHGEVRRLGRKSFPPCVSGILKIRHLKQNLRLLLKCCVQDSLSLFSNWAHLS